MKRPTSLLAILALCAACTPDTPSDPPQRSASVSAPAAMAETPAAGYHVVTLDAARGYVNKFRAEASGATVGLPGSLGGTFGAADVLALLGQPGVTRLRIYNGTHDDGSATLVLVGATDQGQDVTTMVLQQMQECPPFCPSAALGQE